MHATNFRRTVPKINTLGYIIIIMYLKPHYCTALPVFENSAYCFLICLFLRITANRSVENTADAIKYAKLWESFKNLLPTRTHPRSTSNKIDNFEHRRQSHHRVEHGNCALWNFKLIILLIFTSFQPFGLFLDLVKCRRNATGHICDLLCRLEPFWGSNTFIV